MANTAPTLAGRATGPLMLPPCTRWAYSSASVAESSVGARQGTKTSATVNILTPTQLHLVDNLTLIALYLGLIK